MWAPKNQWVIDLDKAFREMRRCRIESLSENLGMSVRICEYCDSTTMDGACKYCSAPVPAPSGTDAKT